MALQSAAILPRPAKPNGVCFRPDVGPLQEGGYCLGSSFTQIAQEHSNFLTGHTRLCWEAMALRGSQAQQTTSSSRFFADASTSSNSEGTSSCQKRASRPKRFTAKAVATSASVPVYDKFADEQDFIKAGGPDIDLVHLQAAKPMDQPTIASQLKTLIPGEQVLDLVVIGCGPAGLALAAEASKQELSVGLIGPDVPFVNNYGVWADEFEDMALGHCLAQTWRDAALYLENNKPVMVGRAYGRVSRELLRKELLERCAAAGVYYLDAEVEDIAETHANASTVTCSNGSSVPCRLVIVASGAASGRFLTYESGHRGVGIQTAYGIEVEVDKYPYDPSVMHFMDYRDWARTHEPCSEEGEFKDIPTFLYAMPVTPTRIFFEETCLAARPAMPFELLKSRLHRRLESLGIAYNEVYEEEWSYIPVGGSLPDTTQRHIGFGAAASMIHPATGYSIARSLREAPEYAASIAAALRGDSRTEATISPSPTSHAAALQAWDCLWSRERKRQRAFMLFGLELILQLDLQVTRDFFETFFRLPERLWKGFLASRLSSVDLLWFALVTFAVAPNSLRYRLVKHLVTDPSGAYLVKAYLGLDSALSERSSPLPTVAVQTFLLAFWLSNLQGH